MSMCIASIGHYLPKNIVTNENLLEKVAYHSGEGTNVADMRKKLKVNVANQRHYISDDESGIIMAEEAAKRCLENGNIDVLDIDLILYVSMYRAYVEPAMSIHIRDAIGAKNSNAFDISNACMGFLNAKELAFMYLETNRYNNVLIVSSEVCSELIPWDMFGDNNDNTGFSALTIGDGAVAMVLKKGGDERNFKLFDMNTYSEHKDVCKIKLGKEKTDLKLMVKSRQLAAIALDIMKEFIPEFVYKAEQYFGEVDIIFIHQVTGNLKRFCGNLREDLYEKVHYSFPTVGNTGSASIPLGMALAEQEGRLKRGDRVVTIVGASGFSCGATAFIY